MTDLNIFTSFVKIQCCRCSMNFQMPRDFYELRKSDGKEFFCPVGHQQYFTETEISSLRKQLQSALSSKHFYQERADHYRESMIKEERRTRGLKSALTLTKKRIAKGKCPCCDKNFDDLRKHIEEKHKTYKEKIIAN